LKYWNARNHRATSTKETPMKTCLSCNLGIVVAMSAIMIGCDQQSNQPSAARNPPSPSTTTTTVANADNTARNRNDLDQKTVTPLDQSNSAANIKITADIRRAILDDKSMSTNAQNCKVITEKNGMVTLRGPVESQIEKDAIEALAKAVAGVTSVSNQLEVKQT